jgi:hypothetical protein
MGSCDGGFENVAFLTVFDMESEWMLSDACPSDMRVSVSSRGSRLPHLRARAVRTFLRNAEFMAAVSLC